MEMLLSSLLLDGRIDEICDQRYHNNIWITSNQTSFCVPVHDVTKSTRSLNVIKAISCSGHFVSGCKINNDWNPVCLKHNKSSSFSFFPNKLGNFLLFEIHSTLHPDWPKLFPFCII